MLSCVLVLHFWIIVILSGCQTAASVPSCIKGRILDMASHTLTLEADQRITYLFDLPETETLSLEIGDIVIIYYEGGLDEERLYQEVIITSIQKAQATGSS